jgi:hypothetical protein
MRTHRNINAARRLFRKRLMLKRINAESRSFSKAASRRFGRSGFDRRSRTFSDPWSFRRVEPLVRRAGFDGRPLDGSTVRWNGRLVYVVSRADPMSLQSVDRPERSMLVELWRRVSAEIAKYRTSDLFSPTELRTIEALWLEGVSLRALARREGLAQGQPDAEPREHGEPDIAPGAAGHLFRVAFRAR